MPRPVETIDPQQIEDGLSVRDRLDLKESDLREHVAKKITIAFIVVNLGVLLLVLFATVLDDIFIGKIIIKPEERLITSNLVMSIIGATTVQLGAIAFAMSNWLFPKSKMI